MATRRNQKSVISVNKRRLGNGFIYEKVQFTLGRVEEGFPTFKSIVFTSYEVSNKKNPAVIPKIK